MSRVTICDDAIEMSVEYFIDLLKQMKIEYSFTKKKYSIQNPKRS